jgi:hypothetical protein
MGILDFLIDKDNGKPKSDMEYIYRLDMVWTPNELGDKPIKKGTIVTNVVQLKNKSYEFLNKETGEVLKTNYAWALAENTPENVERIEIYEKEYKKFKEHEKLINSLRIEIITLKSEGEKRKENDITDELSIEM